MCASALALPRLEIPRVSIQRLAPILIPGFAVGLLAVLAFGTVHAWLIVPIWSQLAGGMPAAILTATAMAWAFDGVARAHGRETFVHGLGFGVYTFATLLPATAIDAAMRLNGVRLGDTTLGTVGGTALFALAGLFAGWISSRQRSTAVVFAIAALALMVLAGGPLPVVRSARGAWLTIGVACITMAAGGGIALVRSFVRHRL